MRQLFLLFTLIATNSPFAQAEEYKFEIRVSGRSIASSDLASNSDAKDFSRTTNMCFIGDEKKVRNNYRLLLV